MDRRLRRQDGGIDHFVANVSALGTEDTPAGWRKAIEIDLVSTVNSVHHVRAASREDAAWAPRCTIIGTVSLVEVAGPTQPYRSVKAALVPFVKSLAIDMAPKGVRANMVSPGHDPRGRQHLGPPARCRRRALQAHAGAQSDGPHGHAAGGRDCVVFLAGTPASFVTGINFIVDGAITARVQY